MPPSTRPLWRYFSMGAVSMPGSGRLSGAVTRASRVSAPA